MKPKKIILSFVWLLLSIGGTASAQVPRKPKIQTSATAGETVYRPQVQAAGSSAAAAGKTTAAKKAAKQTGIGKAPATKKQKAKATQRPQRNTNGKKAAPHRQTTGSPAAPKRYRAFKNNLAFQAAALQNLAFEMQVHDHISVELPLTWSLWDWEREHAIRTVALQPEGRWWLKEAGKGHFFGLHAHVAWFNVKWNDDRYQSAGRPLLGAGISYGYKLPLGEHWGAEFTVGAGYANMKYDTYYNIENGAKLNTYIRNYWGITRIGLSLVYRF